MKNIGIILGYGVFIQPNPNYQKYLDSVYRHFSKNHPDLLIICGGYSNKNYPDISESKSIATFYHHYYPNIKFPIILEEQSLTTAQNLQFALKLLKPNESLCVNIICDSIRVPKVINLALKIFDPIYHFNLSEPQCLKILMKYYLQPDFNLLKKIHFSQSQLSITGIPLSKSAKLASSQILSSMLEMHYLDYPDLHQQFITWRKKQWGIN